MPTPAAEPFYLCIFGSRPNATLWPGFIDPFDHWIHDYEAWIAARMIPPFQDVDCLITGCTAGADHAGELWATTRHIPIHRFPYDRSKGRQGGYARNVQMSRFATHFLAFWDGESRGTKHMIWTVERAEKPLIIIRLDRQRFLDTEKMRYGRL